MFDVLLVADHDDVEIVGESTESQNGEGTSFLLVLAVISAENAGNGGDILIGMDDPGVDHENLSSDFAIHIHSQNRFEVVGLK